MIPAHDATTACVNPLILTVDDFVSRGECDRLIDLGKGQLDRATIYGSGHEPEISGGRTNTGCWLDQTADPVVAALYMKVGMLLRMPVGNAEMMHLLHYAPGQEFRPHHDGVQIAPETAAKVEAEGGQRLFTSILYLNAVTEGGATSFPGLGLSIAPKPGRMLIFANTLAGTNERCSLSLHAGEPVIRGEKWAATLWWREHAPE